MLYIGWFSVIKEEKKNIKVSPPHIILYYKVVTWVKFGYDYSTLLVPIES